MATMANHGRFSCLETVNINILKLCKSEAWPRPHVTGDTALLLQSVEDLPHVHSANRLLPLHLLE